MAFSRLTRLRKGFSLERRHSWKNLVLTTELFVKYQTAVNTQPQILDTWSELWSQCDNAKHNGGPEDDAMWRKFWANHCWMSTRRFLCVASCYMASCSLFLMLIKCILHPAQSTCDIWVKGDWMNKNNNQNFIYLVLFKVNCKAFCIKFKKKKKKCAAQSELQTITSLKRQLKDVGFCFVFLTGAQKKTSFSELLPIRKVKRFKGWLALFLGGWPVRVPGLNRIVNILTISSESGVGFQKEWRSPAAALLYLLKFIDFFFVCLIKGCCFFLIIITFALFMGAFTKNKKSCHN